MRITFVLPPPDMSGGIRVIGIHADKLRQRGHDVLLVYPPNPQPTLRDRLRALRRGTPAGAVPEVSPSHLDSFDIPRRTLERSRAVASSDVPDADVVIATWWETAEWVAALPPQKGAKAYFLQHYEVHEWQPVERVKRTWSLPLHKIAVAKWLADLARDTYGDADVSLVPNSVDLDQFSAPARGKQSHTTIGFMYSSSKWKGADLASEGIRIAGETVKGLSGISFGSDAPNAGGALPNAISFSHRPKQGALAGLYAQCDGWIVASRSEGFGLPILEAMACRTPVIATPTGAAPELLAGGGGIEVAHESPEAIAAAIRKIAAMSNAEWRAMSDAACATARGYTWGDASALFERALNDAIAKALRTFAHPGVTESARV